VANLDVPQLGMVEEGVVDRECPHTRDPEEDIDTFGDECLHQDMTSAPH
jgi:hypothetical protein